MDLYGTFFRRLLMPAWENWIRRRPTLRHLASLERTQWASLDELVAIQEGALRPLLLHAYRHNPYYRERFEAAGISPEDVRTLEDLAALPILTHAAARENPLERESTAPPFPTIRKVTSGSTGRPLAFGYEPASEHWRMAVKTRGYGWAGYSPGDRVFHFWGAVPTPPPLPKRAKIAVDRWLRRETYAVCSRHDDAVLRDVVRRIARVRPKVLVGFAQSIAELARYVVRHDLRDWGPIPVICGAESLYAHDRAAIERAFGAPVFETYGSREVMLIASECDRHDGLHTSMENLIVEIVVREENGRARAAREGESGEVVITDLHNYGMPLIRYALGDVAVAGSHARCSCGRSLVRIRSVQGRSYDVVCDASGASVSGPAFSVLLTDITAKVRRFQFVQHADRSITAKLVPNAPLAATELDELRRNTMLLVRGVDVRIALVDDLPRTPAGKHRLVVVEGAPARSPAMA